MIELKYQHKHNILLIYLKPILTINQDSINNKHPNNQFVH
ncbi:MAG: Hypothetical protein AJITA_00853 [Acetilactobacillus jinshanensis]